MLYIALAIMIAIILVFTIVWLRSPALRRLLEQPKYRLLGIEQDEREQQWRETQTLKSKT
jgi:hypothetical protein